jgi:2-keto-3-deoxy-L-rhamnonate aldolase RhmA
VIDAAIRAEKLVGIFCFAPDQVRPWANAGVRLFLLGGDLGFLGTSCESAASAGREALASTGEGLANA